MAGMPARRTGYKTKQHTTSTQVVTPHGAGGPPPRSSRDVLTKILTARHVVDRRSLLEYSLHVGKAEHFEHLACWLRWKVWRLTCPPCPPLPPPYPLNIG